MMIFSVAGDGAAVILGDLTSLDTLVALGMNAVPERVPAVELERKSIDAMLDWAVDERVCFVLDHLRALASEARAQDADVMVARVPDPAGLVPIEILSRPARKRPTPNAKGASHG